MDSSMMKYMYQHTKLSKDEIFQVFCRTVSLKEFLEKLEIEKKEIEYILSEPMAETHYKEYRKMVNSELETEILSKGV
jgi:nicotinic acid phosphoribosyltransferase